jgi:FtsH-binding integral membrane protein
MNFNITADEFRTADQVNSAMLRVYNNMALAVLNSMIVSYLVSSSPALMALLFGTALKWVVIFAPLVAIFALSFGLEKMTRGQALVALHAFAALMGLSFATIFVVYKMGSIVSAFFSAGILFGTMSAYGYFTKRSLDSLGQFLFVGLIAILIASIVNVFVGNSVAAMVISALAIIIFAGLTAYDTQKIREMISYDTDTGKAEVVGALSLYLDFINIFLNLLQLFGDKKD